MIFWRQADLFNFYFGNRSVIIMHCWSKGLNIKYSLRRITSDIHITPPPTSTKFVKRSLQSGDHRKQEIQGQDSSNFHDIKTLTR